MIRNKWVFGVVAALLAAAPAMGRTHAAQGGRKSASAKVSHVSTRKVSSKHSSRHRASSRGHAVKHRHSAAGNARHATHQAAHHSAKAAAKHPAKHA